MTQKFFLFINYINFRNNKPYSNIARYEINNQENLF